MNGDPKQSRSFEFGEVDREPIRLNDQGIGEISFTVKNIASRIVRGRAELKLVEPTSKTAGLQIVDKKELSFEPNFAATFRVRRTPPPPGSDVPGEKPPDKYQFQLRMQNVDDPDDFTVGPSVAFVPKSRGPVIEDTKKKRPWWFIILLVLIVGGGGYGVYRVIRPPPANETIQLFDKVTADFVATTDAGPAPLEITFFDRSEGDIQSWKWDFGNGAVSTNRDPPAQIFKTAGTNAVTLTVKGEDDPASGITNQDTKTRFIEVFKSTTAKFQGSRTESEGKVTVSYTDISEGVVVSRKWDFGDGSRLSSENPVTHTYTLPGRYQLTLEVTGPGGTSSKQTNIIRVAEFGVRVPPLFGLSERDARNKLGALGFKANVIQVPRPMVRDHRKGAGSKPVPFGVVGTVSGQDPIAGRLLPKGGQVTIHVIK